MPRRTEPLLAACAVLGVLGNVVGVAALADVPGAYRAGEIAAWAEGAARNPRATAASAVAFTLGLLALGGWAHLLCRRGGPLARGGAAAMALGAVLNAAGTIAPLVLVLHVLPGCPGAAACAPVARALLGTTLTLDALFNLLFGAGLAVAAHGLRREGALSPFEGWLGVAAGLATLPVALQFASDPAARWLAVAGPLWLIFVLVSALPRRQGAVAEASPARGAP
ncbi:MAG TPA: hypothetical protein VIW03_16285 [Anaeromyxobacter sp.]